MISFLVLLVILGVVLYLIENYLPMAPPFKIIIRLVVILILIGAILRLFGYAVPFRL